MNNILRIYKAIIFTILLTILSGCAEMVGIGFGVTGGLAETERQQLRYCGPDGRNNWETDKSKGGYITGPKWDRLCGKSGMKFERKDAKEYSPTNITQVEIYKIVSHFSGQAPKVKKDVKPMHNYVILGTLKLPKKWYHTSTINKYLIEKMSEVGANAILEYDTYQDSAMLRKNEVTGKMLNVYRMRVDAILIRYTD